MPNPLVAEEDLYVESGYIEDVEDYIGYGPVIFWNTREVVIPRNMLEYVNPQFYMLNIDDVKKHINYIEAGELGIAHPKVLYHEPETTISGTTYAKKVMFINNYSVTFENGEYRIKLYGGNHNIMDVLNLNHVQGISENSAGLIKVSTGSGLSDTESEKLMNIPTSTDMAEAVWNFALRTLTQEVGLTQEQADKLAAIPTSGDIAGAVWGTGDGDVMNKYTKATYSVVNNVKKRLERKGF